MVLSPLMLVVPVQPGAELPVAVACSNPPSTISSDDPPPPPDVVTVSETVVVCVTPPPVPVTVTLYVPAGVDAPAVMVMVDEPEPGAAIDAGLKLAVAPVGSPLAESETAELKPPETVVLMVEVPEVPCGIDSEPGDALIEKSALLGLKTMLRIGWISMP